MDINLSPGDPNQVDSDQPEPWERALLMRQRVLAVIHKFQTKKLNPDIVSFQTLNGTIQKHRFLWESIGFTTSFVDLTKYYDATLTECTITTNETMVGVHITLLKKSTSQLEIRRLLPNTFLCLALTHLLTGPANCYSTCPKTLQQIAITWFAFIRQQQILYVCPQDR